MDNKQEERKRSSCDVVQQVLHQVQLNPSPSPSLSSSPSHEFSFTISLASMTTATPMRISDKNNIKHSPFAIDLSPADEIFYHGHLLPLHVLSQVPVSPRSSINSLDSFTLPIHEFSQYNNDNSSNNTSSSNTTTTADDQNANTSHFKNIIEEKGRQKLKIFSFLGWRKSKEPEGQESPKSKFDIREVVKRYMRLVKPFLATVYRGRRRNSRQLPRRRQPYSFSGSLTTERSKEQHHRGGRREEPYSSAPASMMASRTNSGLLVGSGSGSVTPTKSDSTMEELQAAIQAAIAHCKNTLATDHQNQPS